MEARAMSAIRYHRPEFDAERGRYVRLSPRAFEAVSRMPRALAGRGAAGMAEACERCGLQACGARVDDGRSAGCGRLLAA